MAALARAATAVLAACLLASATGAAACQEGYFKLDLIRTTSGNNDPIAKCLTSCKVNIAADCKVSITPLNAAGAWVPGIWAGHATGTAKTYAVYQECPLVNSTQIGTGAVKTDIKTAFEGFIYGFNAGTPVKPDSISSIAYNAGGTVTITRAAPSTAVLVFAVTETTILASDVDSNIALPQICGDLGSATNCRDDSNVQGLATACNTGYYGMVLDASVLKVCALCPSGTFGDNGYGCTSCTGGNVSTTVGLATCPTQCGPGLYAADGSNTCQPCPEGTYSDGTANNICTECPADSYAWIPGRSACLRCISGIPYACTEASCSLGTATPGSHVISVGTMATCDLASSYKLDVWANCPSWKTGASPMLQFALEVAGDCSIDVLPITDPALTCSEPLNPLFGANQMRGYYKDTTTILSILPPDVPTSSYMFEIAKSNNAGGLSMNFWGATTNPSATADTSLCTSTGTVQGGQLASTPTSPDVTCPVGSYFVSGGYCYACPTGYACSSNVKNACTPDFYNPILGGSCLTCNPIPIDSSGANTTAPNYTGGTRYTTYAGAAYCTVPFTDTNCVYNLWDLSASNARPDGYQYDAASKDCVLCPTGTYRPAPGSSNGTGTHTLADDVLRLCLDCPAGTYSVEGALGLAECSPCPKGQYNPSPGMGSQETISGVTGQHCLLCPEGSLALSGSQTPTTSVALATGATFCDACPPGTWQDRTDNTKACQSCSAWDPNWGKFTYRSGAASPENNECLRVPSGYKLIDSTQSEIELCDPGTVSFWDVSRGSPAEWRIPFSPTNPAQQCMACSGLDTEAGTVQYAHTYAPRAGMMSCIPCPAGTIPNDVGGGTIECIECPNGQYRDAYTVSATCSDCGVGKEVGPATKQDCTLCRPGTYMNGTMDASDANFCTDCPKHQYRPTAGATSCLLCPKGTQTQDTGNIECTPCPVGYYNGVPGTACQPSPSGTYVNTTGAFYPVPCPKGTWNNEKGQDNCNSCSPGKYANTLGSKECKTCAGGTFSTGQATTCTDCRPGYAAPAGSAACSPCKPGTYAPDAKSATCKACPRGYQCPTSAMRTKAGCPRGTFSNKEGNKLCTPCPINTFSTGGTSSTAVFSCTKCDVGTNTRGLTGQSLCQVIRPQVRRLSS